MKFYYGEKWVEIAFTPNVKTSIQEQGILVSVFNGKNEDSWEISIQEALSFTNSIKSKAPFRSEYVQLDFAAADDKRPNRFGIKVKNVVAPVIEVDADLICRYINKAIDNIIESDIMCQAMAAKIIKDAGLEEEISEEEAMEKYPVSDKRNPLNLNYKKK